MKKLMIVAAAAAMISGAYADMVFDFTAKVTTTKAKSGSDVKETARIGRKITGEWWYAADGGIADGILAYNADPNYLDYGAYEKVAKKDKTGVYKLQLNKLDADGKAALAVDLAAYNVPETYKGRQTWCATWTYTIPGTCIRTKGSETIKSWFDDGGAGCCYAGPIMKGNTLVLNEGIWDSKNKLYVSGVWLLGNMTITTLYRFGAVPGTKCNNIEAVGYIGDAGVGQDSTGDATYYVTTTIPNFAIAGQGTWGKNTAADKTFDNEAIQKLSGNIVGIWYESECEVCCGADKSSLAYACDLSAHNIGDGIDGFVDPEFGNIGDDAFMGLVDLYGSNQWGTAAFGTFTLTFNKAASWNL